MNIYHGIMESESGTLYQGNIVTRKNASVLHIVGNVPLFPLGLGREEGVLPLDHRFHQASLDLPPVESPLQLIFVGALLLLPQPANLSLVVDLCALQIELELDDLVEGGNGVELHHFFLLRLLGHNHLLLDFAGFGL